VGKRLFIAVDIDEVTREQVGRISTRVREALDKDAKVSWVRLDRMHLTLHFFGDADATLEQRMRDALARPIRDAAFEVSFHGLGFFPGRGSPRVLWLGIRDGLGPLCRIHAALARAHEPFTPHLTLARFRGRVPRSKVVGITDIPAIAGPSRIDRVTLYESRLSPAGPTYIPLAEALLIPPG
jgi:2'-5' RNA ligase